MLSVVAEVCARKGYFVLKVGSVVKVCARKGYFVRKVGLDTGIKKWPDDWATFVAFLQDIQALLLDFFKLVFHAHYPFLDLCMVGF